MVVMDHPETWMVNLPFTPGAKNATPPQFVSSPEVSGGGQRAPSLLLHQPGILA